ncbi:MAG: response regulator [Deltaproteobacteria bacterium]|nr:response regulator [Deltaproteobacteria bacterium]
MGDQKKLLIIDDDAEILAALDNYLRKKNYNVSIAANGLDGLKLLESEPEKFDLIITDLVMPSISGVAIIAIAKKKFPDIPVIAITGWGEHPEALATEAEADLVMEKPFELSVLENKIIEILSGKNNE